MEISIFRLHITYMGAQWKAWVKLKGHTEGLSEHRTTSRTAQAQGKKARL